jgi:hypothetical protein
MVNIQTTRSARTSGSVWPGSRPSLATLKNNRASHGKTAKLNNLMAMCTRLAHCKKHLPGVHSVELVVDLELVPELCS